MGKSEVYILVAVFVLLMVMIVWLGVKMIADMRRRKRVREDRRTAWHRRMEERLNKQ